MIEEFRESNRKVLMNHFTEAGLNSDVYNDVIAIQFELERITPGDTFTTPAPRTYRGYFVEKCKDDPEMLEKIMAKSDVANVALFDAQALSLKHLLQAPATDESISEIKRRLREVYTLIYKREPSHL